MTDLTEDQRKRVAGAVAEAQACGYCNGDCAACQEETNRLAPVVAQMLTEQWEAVAEELLAEGAGPGSSLHSWRCEYPDRYGPCDCVPETARAVLARLGALAGGGLC